MEKTAYWNYLKTSLELDNFIVPVREPQAALYNEAGELGFFMAEGSELTADEKVMFEKMILAMGLTLDRVALFLTKKATEASVQARFRVAFTDEAGDPTIGTWQEHSGVRTMTTHSLKNLLLNPNLKKSTWEHLKAVRAALA